MNAAYPLIPIATIVLSGYFTTWIFARWNIITKQLHRRLWNYSLLISFLGMAFLGLLAIIKINYKLSIPISDQLLRWHVSGIIME
jgi:TRAP-type C4-dicarboxylate transport system permease small subunit